ncbi:GNAT family N-acetyltransferase [Cytobacillus solani]|uniref:Acetyltransferase n=1 Tax=Cytobacillus solani TaxID=1637975 RepID=A0A0Q3QJ56_9BACI|nr:GNAT family N-acetyltransferase [Cytobacillus solani]KOP71249.1 acetyltransferase [Bacillus sp. FJAT-21945]KQL17809.1 acetyltransferase [Cytobacillus solani]USK55622.1 GNAT family N-acetyltransferase [Cytobacillus solani]
MIEIKRLKDCTIEEGVEAWNTGFEGYYFDATTTADKFITRLVHEGLSPNLSIVAFMDKKPIGIVKNGIREFNGKKLAWNGGTGVALDLRKKGIGRMLMEETLSILNEEKVDYASLEAISENVKAISLYEKMGYEIVDHLEYLGLNGQLENNYSTISLNKYKIERAVPQQIGLIPFYKGMNPWQTQWQSARDGEAMIVKDSDENPIGYAYFRRTFNNEGKHINTVLYQCEVEPEQKDAEQITKSLINAVFRSFTDDINRVIPNLPIAQSGLTHSILKAIGFKSKTEQVYMIKKM